MAEESKAPEYVQRYVRFGFYTPAEIEEIVGQDVFNGKFDAGQLRAMIAQAVVQKLAEEATWPRETDCDRLDAVFDTLEDQGVIALQNAGYTQSDGLSDVAEVYREACSEESGFDGYCFYHGQDLERVVESGALYLAFGDVEGDDVKGTEIGHRIKRAFEAAGFVVEWNESIKTRLLVSNIRWQRRCPQDV
jgi:hypothetical protein